MLELIVSLIFTGIIILLVDKYYLHYWTRRGVKQIETSFFFGNIRNVLLQRESLGILLKRIYRMNKDEKYFGIYFLYRPVLVVNDPKLINDIMIKDFSSFSDRGLYFDEKRDILSAHLITLEGQKWRNLRVKLSPVFTSGKLKGMFPIFAKCADQLENYIGAQVELNEGVIDVRDLSARFLVNVISSVAFGVEVDCINEPNHLFREISRKLFSPNFKNNLRAFRGSLFPKSKLFWWLKQTDDDVEKFFVDLVRETIEYRRKHGIERNDFMQLLIQLMNEGSESVEGNHKITFEVACAQVFMFYTAGFESSSTVISFCLYELAKNPDAQRKLQKEIDEILLTDSKTHELSYEKIMSMKYLKACVQEALRKYPPITLITRRASQNYLIPDSGTTIEKGTQVIFPVYAMQNDPDLYQNPEKFIPERFLEKSTNNIGAFGDGPRKCIANRMAYMITEIAVVAMLSKFKIELPKNSEKIDIEKNLQILVPCMKINLKFSDRIRD